MRVTKKDKERISNILLNLKNEYPDSKCELDFTTPFELLIATMLSAQCTDKQVNKCTAILFKEYNTPKQFASLSEDELAPYIKGCGLYRTKCRNIIATSRIIATKYNGNIPSTRDELMSLPGVGRKTANVVLSNAFHIPAIAVDTHVFRVANRLGLAKADDVLNTEKQLMQNIPKESWSDAHHFIIFHGRRVCSARNPKCTICTVAEFCKEYNKKQKKCNS